MHHISKNWECVFDFQYKVAIRQCEFNQTYQLLLTLALTKMEQVMPQILHDSFMGDFAPET